MKRKGVNKINIGDYLDKQEVEITSLFEYKLLKKIDDFVENFKIKKPYPLSIGAEIIAFNLWENTPYKETSVSTYYGPHGGKSDVLPISHITEDVVDYWIKRANESKHPLLKLKYADLSIDFSDNVYKKPIESNLKNIVVDTTCRLSVENLIDFELDMINKLERALSIVLKLNQKSGINMVKTSIIDYEKKIAQDSMIGIWGFSYRMLIENKKVTLTDDEEKHIIKELEDRLIRVSSFSENKYPDIGAVKQCVRYLGKYYHKKKKIEEKKRIVESERNIYSYLEKHEPAAVIVHYLKELYQFCLEIGLKEERSIIYYNIERLNPEVNKNMTTFCYLSKIKKEDLNRFCKSLINDNLDDSIKGIVRYFTPDKDKILADLKLASQGSLAGIFTKMISNSEGRAIAKIPPLTEDEEANIKDEIRQNMLLESIFLEKVIEELLDKFRINIDTISDYFLNKESFENVQYEIFREGLKNYLDKNYIVAAHLLIPQVERILRSIVIENAGEAFKIDKENLMKYKTLNALLKSPEIKELLDRNELIYIEVVLSSSLGWNLRNDLCHGTIEEKDLNSQTLDRIFHILLMLSLVTKDNKSI